MYGPGQRKPFFDCIDPILDDNTHVFGNYLGRHVLNMDTVVARDRPRNLEADAAQDDPVITSIAQRVHKTRGKASCRPASW